MPQAKSVTMMLSEHSDADYDSILRAVDQLVSEASLDPGEEDTVTIHLTIVNDEEPEDETEEEETE